MDGIEQEYRDRLLVIRLNVQETVGRELAPVYGFEYTPTFIFFDAQGSEIWREVGTLDAQRVQESLE
ncbi:MAG: thioredoxin family protein [Chloroflexi bacterium]|nr:thioredoxin family protein [Chloroflexota bacterium]